MDIRFDAIAAEKLVQQMESYCQTMSSDGSELLDILEATGEWKDEQARTFTENIMTISRDLIKTLGYYSDYMEIFKARVAELRG